MNVIEKLTETFKDFPGIGERQAKRFVYFLMSRDNNYNENLVKNILELKKEVSRCISCYRFFLINNKNTKVNVCSICNNENVDNTKLMVLEKDSDLESVYKSKSYNGKYFILGNLIPVVEKKTLSFVRIKELKDRLNKDKDIKELILAFSISPQGDHTDFYLRGELKDILEKNNIKISSLGRGLSTGTELEYSDNETLKNALKNRQ